MGYVEVVNCSKNQTVIAGRVLWAGTGEERRRGLLGRTRLGPDEGIYIVPCEWVHTFGMKFAIDIAFVAPDGAVLAVQHGLRPWRLSKLIWRAEGVLELAPGRLRDTGTCKGDRLGFRDL